MPHEISNAVEVHGFKLIPRLWATTTFDLATLGASHRLEYSWHLLEVFLGSVSLEIEVAGSDSLEGAVERLRVLQSMLYIDGVAPFIAPVAMTHPILDYSGINSRDSDALRASLPEELQAGFRSTDGTIRGWLHEASLTCMGLSHQTLVTASMFDKAAARSASWERMERTQANLRVARAALLTSPIVPDLGSSILNIWQGIEGLFPKVSAEITFRLSLMIAQLCAPLGKSKVDVYRASKVAYAKRSKAAHGRSSRLTGNDWWDAWNLLATCLLSCLERGKMPDEDELIMELLDSEVPTTA